MAKITKLVSQKRSGRVNVYLDDKFAFGVNNNLIIDFGLYAGKELSGSYVIKIKEAENFSLALSSAFRLLSVRQRSEAELKKRLLTKYTDSTVNEVFKKLSDYQMISDLEFARTWIEERKNKKGKKALIYELKNKGVKSEIYMPIINAITIEEEQMFAQRVFEKKFKKVALKSKTEIEKTQRFLLARGYSFDVIKKVIDEYR